MDLGLDTVIPSNPNAAYDMREVIERVVDEGDFFEVMPDFAKNIIIGFARMEGTASLLMYQTCAMQLCSFRMSFGVLSRA